MEGAARLFDERAHRPAPMHAPIIPDHLLPRTGPRRERLAGPVPCLPTKERALTDAEGTLDLSSREPGIQGPQCPFVEAEGIRAGHEAIPSPPRSFCQPLREPL